jgi:hypothetical protein
MTVFAIGNIDVAIPLVGGFLLLIWPRKLLWLSGDGESQAAQLRKVRLGGMGCMVIGAGYALLKQLETA